MSEIDVMLYILDFIRCLVIPVVIIIESLILKDNMPERGSRLCSHLSKMSVKNDDTWAFAQKRYCRYYKKTGWPMLAVTVVVAIISYCFDFYASIIVFIAQAIILVVIYIVIEMELNETFDEEGNKRK